MINEIYEDARQIKNPLSCDLETLAGHLATTANRHHVEGRIKTLKPAKNPLRAAQACIMLYEESGREGYLTTALAYCVLGLDEPFHQGYKPDRPLAKCARILSNHGVTGFKEVGGIALHFTSRDAMRIDVKQYDRMDDWKEAILKEIVLENWSKVGALCFFAIKWSQR